MYNIFIIFLHSRGDALFTESTLPPADGQSVETAGNRRTPLMSFSYSVRNNGNRPLPPPPTVVYFAYWSDSGDRRQRGAAHSLSGPLYLPLVRLCFRVKANRAHRSLRVPVCAAMKASHIWTSATVSGASSKDPLSDSPLQWLRILV